jgi:hypothetical protein
LVLPKHLLQILKSSSKQISNTKKFLWPCKAAGMFLKYKGENSMCKQIMLSW